MSLDVYLSTKIAITKPPTIYIREDGQSREISRDEWDKLFPGTEPVMAAETESYTVFTANITHNLNKMADKAELYQYLWRPEELHISKASELIEPLASGLEILKSDPVRFKRFNPSNGWGSYEGLVSFVEKYLSACKRYPEAEVSTWR